MPTANTLQSAGAPSERKSSARLIEAALFLVLTDALYITLSAKYGSYLIHTGQFSAFRSKTEYASISDSLFYLVQLLVVTIFFGRHSVMSIVASGKPGSRPSFLRSVGLGFLTGLVGFLCAVPILLKIKHPSSIASFLANHIFEGSGIILLFLLIFLIPTASETFFRGILLSQLLERMSGPVALLFSTLLYTMFCWPVFFPVVGLILGAAVGVLFYRGRSVAACAVANATFSLGCLAVMMWLTLRQ